LLAENVSSVANVAAAGALVFGQFLSGQRFSLPLVTLGALVWAALVAWALFLIKERPE
jgi:hypothetical protein